MRFRLNFGQFRVGYGLFGFGIVETTIAAGKFACPGCGANREFHRNSVRRYQMIFFVPVVPLGYIDDRIECQHCRRYYHDEEIQEHESRRREAWRVEFSEHLKRLMALTAQTLEADEEAQNLAVREAAKASIDLDLTRADVSREFYLIRLAKTGMAPYPRRFAGELDLTRKMKAIEVVLRVASAAPEMNAETRTLLEGVAAEMRISPHQLQQFVHGMAVPHQQNPS